MYLYETQMLYYLKAKYIAKTETALVTEQVELTDKHAVHTEAVEHSSWCRARFHPCTSTPLLMASGRGTLPAATRQTLAQGTRLCRELKLCLHKSCTRSSALVWAAQGGGREGRKGRNNPPPLCTKHRRKREAGQQPLTQRVVDTVSFLFHTFIQAL